MLLQRSPFYDFGPLGLRRAFSAMDELRREVERALGEFEPTIDTTTEATDWAAWPRSSLRDLGDALLIRAEVPGLSEQDLQVSVTGDSVTLTGERKDDSPKGYSVHRKERAAFTFRRSFFLPVRVDTERAEATIKYGVLELRLPKVAEAQPKQITIKAT